MGRRGRKPTPTAALKLRGSWRAKERSDASVDGVSQLAAPPEWMSAAAVAQWDAIGAWLVGWGVMLDRYEPSLAELCDAYASFVSISRAAEGQPYWIDTERGGLKVHPIWALKDQAAKRLKDSLSRHGLAPSAAPSIKTEQAPKASGLGALKLNRGNLPKLA